MKDNSFSITNKTKGALPRVPFLKLKNHVLGEKFELSIVFVGEEKIRQLNNIYRKKNKPTDILSFNVEKNVGEIFICPKISKKKMKEFHRKYNNFIAFLFIHGLFHLKGMDHSSRMDKAEEVVRRKFGI